MDLFKIAAAATENLIERLLRRALLAFLLVLFALIAIYHVTAAGTLALEARFGEVHAQLIVAAIYTGVALMSLAGLWATAGRLRPQPPVAPKQPPEGQLAMLLEAIILGFSSGAKKKRSR